MQTFYFYDLETSGVNPREARIMQFAGQRTDMQLHPIGEPHNVLIKMTDDTLPDPEAILITGITPQKTIAEGVTEAEFLKLFWDEIATEGTTFVGYNTVRFDDEFLRYLHYRNFYDPYEWQWKDNRSRWDLLDMVRLTRALRPEGIEWPFDSDGKPTNRLELLTELNGLDHANAHDALSDVKASIALANLIRTKQPKLFEYQFEMRDKKKVKALVEADEPFVYTSGKYSNEWEKTSVVVRLAEGPDSQSALVYDLRFDPTEFEKMSDAELQASWQRKRDDPGPRLPVKALKYNRCPAVAPLGVLDEPSKRRLQIDMEQIKQNLKQLRSSKLGARCLRVAHKMNELRAEQSGMLQDTTNVDARLYDGFVNDQDKTKMSMVRAADMSSLTPGEVTFEDERLNALLPLYKARNYPHILNDDERAQWEAFRRDKLTGGGEKSQLARFGKRLQELDVSVHDDAKRYLLEELTLYAQSIAPIVSE